MGFLVRQEGAERVYLCRAHVFAAERFHGLQQAVGAQELGMVMAVVRFVPADDALAQQASRVIQRWASLMSRRTCRMVSVPASISLMRLRSCTKMAAMLPMTAIMIT